MRRGDTFATFPLQKAKAGAGNGRLRLGVALYSFAFPNFTLHTFLFFTLESIARSDGMGKIDDVDYWVPEHVREHLRGMGFQLPLEPMEGHIRAWHEWMQAGGSFYDYRDSDGFGRVYEVHRRSIHPAMRVCREWGSLLLNDKTQVVCESQECTDWLQSYFEQTGFFPSAQATVVRAFGMGTGAWALWIDAGRKDVRIRRYDARMVIPLSWDEERVTECAFVTRAYYRGRAVDQLQMHLLGGGDGGTPSTAFPSTYSQALATGSLTSLPIASKTGAGVASALPGTADMATKTVAGTGNGGGAVQPSTPSPSHGKGRVPSKWKAGDGYAGVIPSTASPSQTKAGGNGYGGSPSKDGARGTAQALGGAGASPSASSPCEAEGNAGAQPYDGLPTYRIVTVCFDEDGNEIQPEGVCTEYETGCPFPTFSIVKPAIENTRVDMSPYGQSIFADAIDAIQAVDLAFDAMITEVDISKMRVFLSDVMFDREQDGKKKRVAIPFGRQDCTVFRKVMSTDDMIQEFAPALRTASQVEALRIALQMLGDLCGFGITYFDFDSTGYVKTATEVSSDNSALMRNIARHEHVLEQSIAGIARALLHIARGFGVDLPHEGDLKVMFDDSIIADTFQEKKQDLSEVGVTMTVAEFRQKWYGEDLTTSEERASKLDV